MNPYLTSKTPPERYALFLRGSLMVIVGYLIVAAETFLAIYLELTDMTYEKIIYLTLSIISLNALLTLMVYFRKNLIVWQEWSILGIYLISFLAVFTIWTYLLGALRILGLLNALTAIIIVLSFTNIIQSLLMTSLTLFCYFAAAWFSIIITGHGGMPAKEIFISLCLLPCCLLISSAAFYMNKKSRYLRKIKSELKKLNISLTAVNEKLVKEQMMTEIELDLASKIQLAIFPSKTPYLSDWDIAFMAKPFNAVSGDFYDFYCNGDSLHGIALFDVSGHGVAPALITILAKPVIYHHFMRLESSKLGVVMESAEEDIIDELEKVNLYITGLLLRMNGRDVEYVNAGHPDLLHFNSSEKKVCVVADSAGPFKGHPLGISISKEKYRSVRFTVQPGDFIILYSDGLTEGRNYLGKEFGVSGLSNVIQSFNGGNAAGLLDHILGSFNNFTEDLKADDDITIIIAGKI